VVTPHRCTAARRIKTTKDVTGIAEQNDEFTFVDVEIDVLQGGDLDFPHPVDLRETARAKHHRQGTLRGDLVKWQWISHDRLLTGLMPIAPTALYHRAPRCRSFLLILSRKR
jgi:hypothetical protein